MLLVLWSGIYDLQQYPLEILLIKRSCLCFSKLIIFNSKVVFLKKGTHCFELLKLHSRTVPFSNNSKRKYICFFPYKLCKNVLIKTNLNNVKLKPSWDWRPNWHGSILNPRVKFASFLWAWRIVGMKEVSNIDPGLSRGSVQYGDNREHTST